MTTPDGPPLSTDTDTGSRPPAGPAGPAPCEVLLDELLAVIGRLETDFKSRWDATRFGVS